MSWKLNIISRPTLSCLECNKNPIPIAIGCDNTEVTATICESNTLKIIRENGATVLDAGVENYKIVQNALITYQIHKATGHTHR